MKQHLTYIDSLRVIATILVMLIHISSVFISSNGLTDTDNDYTIYHNIHLITLCAVAVFVMISGSLLLSKPQAISYQQVFSRYIPRILWVLLFFSLPMCLMQEFMQNRSASFLVIIFNSIINFLTGNSWTHMWYLYMLPCLYLLTPLLHTYILNTEKKDHTYLAVALTVLGIILPNITQYGGMQISGYLHVPSFIATFYLGFYVTKYFADSMRIRVVSCCVLIFYLLYYILPLHGNKTMIGPESLLSVTSVVSLFCIVRHKPVLPSICQKLSPHTFCIYIIHPVFLNIMFKVLHIERSTTLHPILNIIIVATITLLLSLLTSIILHRIPFLRNKAL